MEKFYNLLAKFLKGNEKTVLSDSVVYSMNGVVLSKTGDKLFDLHSCFCREVQEYCNGLGYNIQKVIFFTGYDSDLNFSVKNINIKMRSDSVIEIVKEDNIYIARVFMGYNLETRTSKDENKKRKI